MICWSCRGEPVERINAGHGNIIEHLCQVCGGDGSMSADQLIDTFAKMNGCIIHAERLVSHRSTAMVLRLDPEPAGCQVSANQLEDVANPSDDYAPRQRLARRGISRLAGLDYSEVPPVLARGKRRTLARKLAAVIDWNDERANLYGCHPCPRCGEVRIRAGIQHGDEIRIVCGVCGDKRIVR